jgi:hypothetical protein
MHPTPNDPRLGYYFTAQICLSGHLITPRIEQYPERGANFCPKCGNETIRNCRSCSTPIRGAYSPYSNLAPRHNHYSPPNHCHECGAAFPWTEAKLVAAKEHALELEGLDEGEKQQLQNTLDDLASDGPRTELGASRFKRLMKKAGQTAGSGLYKIAIDLASEAAKKSLLGP